MAKGNNANRDGKKKRAKQDGAKKVSPQPQVQPKGKDKK